MPEPFRLTVLGGLDKGECHLSIIAEFEACRAIGRTSLSSAELGDLQSKIRDLRGCIEGGYPHLERPDLVALGREFFSRAIHGQIQILFSQATGKYPRMLPLDLLIEDYTVAGWPWEYLYDPTRELFVCQEFHPISRSVFTLTPTQTPKKKQESVHILLVVAVKSKDPNAPAEEEIRWLTGVFRKQLPDSVSITVKRMTSPLELNLELDQGNYDVFHFFGHAAYDTDRREGLLSFEQPAGDPIRLCANDFARLLSAHKIRLVFLNACETAKAAPDRDPGRSSVAAALLSRGIPAVVATQFTMPEVSAPALSAAVYNALAAGKPVAEALRSGRQAMTYVGGSKYFDWGIPVLYSSDPNLIMFAPSPSLSAERGIAGPGLSERSEDGADGSSVMIHASIAVPGILIPETTPTRSPTRSTKVKVALVDIDSRAGYLPDLVEKANRVQEYYHFDVAYPPIPAGGIRTDFEREGTLPQLFLPWVEEELVNLPDQLQTDFVCCLTQNLVAGMDEDELYWNHFSAPLARGDRVRVISTFEVREFSQQANVSFAKSVLLMCLGQLVVGDARWRVGYHGATAGCLFDYCENRSDIVEMLRHMKFDHTPCRRKIKDNGQLSAIDALVALEA